MGSFTAEKNCLARVVKATEKQIINIIKSVVGVEEIST